MRTSVGRRRSLAGWCVLVGLVVWQAAAWAALPAPQGRVNDFARVLDDATRWALQSLIDETEQQTTAEIAVVTVPSLDGMTAEAYASGLFTAWRIGKNGPDNGLLVLVCPGERVMRIEVGYGLEGVLPDGLSGAVIRDHFTPKFKDGDYAGGILAGVRRLSEIVRANHVLTPEELRQMAEDEAVAGRPPTWLTTPFFGLFIGLGFGVLGAGLRSRDGFFKLFGALFGGVPFLMSLLPFLNASLWVLLPLAIGTLALGYFEGGRAGGGPGEGVRVRRRIGQRHQRRLGALVVVEQFLDRQRFQRVLEFREQFRGRILRRRRGHGPLVSVPPGP